MPTTQKQRINGILVYARHSATCKHQDDSSHVKCGCPLWLQWQENGQTLQRSAKTRSITQARMEAEKRDRINRGEEAPTTTDPRLTIMAGIKVWLDDRTAQKIGNVKAEFMGRVLVEWLRERNPPILYWREITVMMMTEFFSAMSQRFSSDTSSSLKQHWSMIKSLFKFAVANEFMVKNPLVERKLLVTPEEVIIPEEEDIRAILNAANTPLTQIEWLYIQTLLEMGQAPIDTVLLKRNQIKGNHVSGVRSKTKKKGKRFDVDLPGWLVDALRASSYGHKDYFFYDGMVTPASAIKVWYRRLQPIFKAAKTKVEMHPYLLRHYFISSKIADGFSADEVAAMAGNSVAQIEKTYKHLLNKGSKRILAKQQAVWLAQGLDENGNARVGLLQ
jgi:integrase